MSEAWWVLLGFHLALQRVPLERLENFTGPASERSAVLPDALALARRRQELISMAARLHYPSMTCLPKAFTLRWRLSRAGIPAQLRIGTNKISTGILAHAWVEVDGQAIGEPEDITEKFKLLSRVEPQPSQTN